MSLKPITQRQQDTIVKNVIAACKDISKLNKAGYNFLYLCSGFIAHYDIAGFKAYYDTDGDLIQDLYQFERINQWHNFQVGQRNYDYYMSRKQTYNKIMVCLRN